MIVTLGNGQGKWWEITEAFAVTSLSAATIDDSIAGPWQTQEQPLSDST